MGNTENIEKLYDLLDKQVEKIVAKNDITPNELESMYKSICVMEKIDKMIYGDSGNSETASYGHSYDYSYGMPYDDYGMNSGYRGRSPMTGRFVSRDGRSNRGMSGHSIKDRIISRLEHMMDETNSEYEKEEISKYIRTFEMNNK